MSRNNKKRIKVISVVTRVAMDSAGKQAILITDNLDKEIYETILVTGSCEANEVDMSRWINGRDIRHVHIPEMKREIRPYLDFIAFCKIFWLFIKEKPDIVHTRTAKSGTLGRVAAKLSGVPILIHTFDGHVFNGYFGKHKTFIILSIERILARFTNRIIAISNSQKKDLLGFLKIKNPDKIRVVHIGFDFDEFKPPANGALRKELHLDDDDLLVGFVGRLAPIKRVDRLINAYEEVTRKVPQGKLVIVGDGELRGEMQEMVRMKKLEDKIFFLGVRQDLETVYSGIDVIAMSSDNEGTPAVLIEALTYGKPVASTNVGGIPDVVTDGFSGLLAKANGHSDLANALIEMLNNRELREELGDNGRNDVHRKFSLQNLISKLDSLYMSELKLKPVRFKKLLKQLIPTR
ncbi:glycosyltransferase family 4 protein [bacterium]|nr:glycosyltransferase family 4 protein [bacterium]